MKTMPDVLCFAGFSLTSHKNKQKEMFKQIPTVTKNLLIINIIVFLAQLVGEQRGVDLVSWLGLHFVLADDFQLWQLVTYMFLHADFTHIFFNLFSLWMFGRIIEQTFGAKRFFTYYMVCGIGAGICQELWQLGEYFLTDMYRFDWVNTGTARMAMGDFLNLWTTIGASGACYGVLLAFGMLYPNERIMLLIPPIPMKAKYFVAGYAAIELFSAFASSGNIAHFAHLGGMLFGWLLIRHWRNERRRQSSFSGWNNWAPPHKKSFWEQCKERWRKLTERKPKMRVEKGARFKDRAADYEYNRKENNQRPTDERIEKILEKIKQSGYESLTADEKRDLFQNSRKR